MNHAWLIPKTKGFSAAARKSFLSVIIIFPIIVIFIVLVSVSCAGDVKNQNLVRVGWLPLVYGLPHFLAVEDSMYQKHGLQVESIMFPTSNDLADALAAGRIDVSAPTALSVLYALEARSPGLFKLFSVYATRAERPTDYLLVNTASSISTIADLKGKRIGTFPGSTMRLYARLGLKPDLDLPSDAKLIELRPELQLSALLGGQVDALLTYDADAATILSNSSIRVLASGIKGRIMDPFPSGGFAFSSQFLSANPASAATVRDVFHEAVGKITGSPDSAKSSAKAFLSGLTDEAIERINLPDYWVAPAIETEYMEAFKELLLEADELDKDISVQDTLYKAESK